MCLCKTIIWIKRAKGEKNNKTRGGGAGRTGRGGRRADPLPPRRARPEFPPRLLRPPAFLAGAFSPDSFSGEKESWSPSASLARCPRPPRDRLLRRREPERRAADFLRAPVLAAGEPSATETSDAPVSWDSFPSSATDIYRFRRTRRASSLVHPKGYAFDPPPATTTKAAPEVNSSPRTAPCGMVSSTRRCNPISKKTGEPAPIQERPSSALMRLDPPHDRFMKKNQ